MSRTVKALVIQASGVSEVRDIVPDLDTLQGIVGGYIENVSAGDANWHAYCDEEGKLKRKEPNRLATMLAWELGWPRGDILVGDVVFLGEDPENSAEEGDVPQRVVDTWLALSQL